MTYRLPMDENYRRLKYVRYADDFLIGVIGSKADCERIKADITEYMMNNLKLELSAEKTLITHAKRTLNSSVLTSPLGHWMCLKGTAKESKARICWKGHAYALF